MMDKGNDGMVDLFDGNSWKPLYIRFYILAKFIIQGHLLPISVPPRLHQPILAQKLVRVYNLAKQYMPVPVNPQHMQTQCDSQNRYIQRQVQSFGSRFQVIKYSLFFKGLTGLYSFFLIFQQQLIQIMPFIHRTLNHFPHSPSPVELVKHEENSLLIEESSLLSEENKLVQNRQGNEGRWNEEENLRFVLFVHYYQDIFASQHKRKASKIFRTFAEYLTERTAAQCRSHYQKMIIKHKTIAKLKKHYKNLYGDRKYNEEFQSFKTQWEVTHPSTLKASVQIKEFKEISIQTDEQHGQTHCQNCGVRSQSELMTSSTSAFKPYFYWDVNQYQSSPPLNFYYWIPQANVASFSE